MYKVDLDCLGSENLMVIAYNTPVIVDGTTVGMSDVFRYENENWYGILYTKELNENLYFYYQTETTNNVMRLKSLLFNSYPFLNIPVIQLKDIKVDSFIPYVPSAL